MRNPLFIILSAFLLMGQNVWGEKVTQRVHFSFSELKVGTRTGEDGVVYNNLSYEDCYYNGEFGSPALPVKYISVQIPYFAEDISLSVESSNVRSEHLSYWIFPNQEEAPTLLGDYKMSFVPCDSAIYNSSLPYPRQNAQIVSVPVIGEEEKYVKIAISPIKYYPLSNKIEFAEQIDVTIGYNISTFKRNLSKSKAKRLRESNIGIPFYEYCIITNNDLKASFERLIAWRRQNGLNAGVVCVEDILNNTDIIGDTVSSFIKNGVETILNDDAGKLRQYLRYAYESGITKYVLFGGDDSVVPIRYGSGFNTPFDEEDLIPSDFYFSELNSNWISDGDSIIGDPYDHLNYGGQLYVGRILCTKPSEIINYTNKLLRYELYPGNGDFSYLKKAFFQQADEMQRDKQANIIANALGDIFTTKTIIQESPHYYARHTISPKGKEVIESMKANYGYVSWFGHGHPNAITTKSDTLHYKKPNGSWVYNRLYQPYGISSVEDDVPYMMSENGNGLDCLGNKDYPMIAYSISCTITPFDKFKEYTEFPNIGQSFTLGKDYGGPALIGNTRNGWVSYSYLYQKDFNEYAICEPLGEALVHARASFCSSSTYPHFLSHSSNLIGCPFIRLWTDIPSPFNATVTYQSNHPILSCNTSRTSAEAGARDITQVSETSTTSAFDPSTQPLAWENGGNLLITLTGKNCLPQILPLKLQDVTLQGTHYAIVKDVECGRNVRNGTQGDVNFDENADYTFETKGTFRLDKGVKVNQGAKLKVIPSEINY